MVQFSGAGSQSSFLREARAAATASYSDPAVTSVECSTPVMSATQTLHLRSTEVRIALFALSSPRVCGTVQSQPMACPLYAMGSPQSIVSQIEGRPHLPRVFRRSRSKCAYFLAGVRASTGGIRRFRGDSEERLISSATVVPSCISRLRSEAFIFRASATREIRPA
jgi:hypothetical protein